MLDNRIRMLVTTVHKLYRRGAKKNVQRILAKTHTADVAEVIENLEVGENLEVLRLEPSLERRAEILAYLKRETQGELLVMMEDEESQNLVSRMESDDAADLLGSLPEDFSNKILKMMEREDSEEVTDLMGYPEDSAGGLMSPDFMALNQNMTVSHAITTIQELDDESLILFYLYVVDDNEQLVGVLSLKQLLLAKPTDTLSHVLISDVITVPLEMDQQEVARLVERYDFLAIPVVDDAKKLMGVITVDDVLDVIREEAEEEMRAMGRAGWSADASTFEHIKARFPWLLLSFLGGVACFFIIFSFVDQKTIEDSGVWWYVAATLPLVLILGATAGNQALSISLGTLREDRPILKISEQFVNEVKVSVPLALLFMLLFLGVAALALDNLFFAGLLAVGVGVHMLTAMYLGTLAPFWLDRVGIDATIASIPIYSFLADIGAVALLFTLAQMVPVLF